MRQRDRETERQRDRETERQRDRETERQIDRETERQRDRETERASEKDTLYNYMAYADDITVFPTHLHDLQTLFDMCVVHSKR